MLDLSAAFYTVDNQILLKRLSITYGISGTALEWFRSYLSDRCQSVSVAGLLSKYSTLKYSVPQGSVLGPILFIMYTQPLADIVSSHDCYHHAYAGDVQLYQSVSMDKSLDLKSLTETCVDDISKWMHSNKLKLNEDKTESILIKSKQSKCSSFETLNLGSQVVNLTNKAKNLGVVLDSELSMSNHISYVCQVSHFKLRRISKMKKYLTTEACAQLVVSLIFSHIDYCNSILFGINNSLLQRLQKVQNHAARVVLNKKMRDSARPLLIQLHWLPIKFRIDFKIACIVYKCLNNQAPSYLLDLITPYVPARPLRSQNDPTKLVLPKFKLKTFGYRSFSVAGPTVWNEVPQHIRETETFDAFKRQLKTYLFTKFVSET